MRNTAYYKEIARKFAPKGTTCKFVEGKGLAPRSAYRGRGGWWD